MTWSLTQSGTSFSGSLALTDNNTGTKANGTVSGSISGSSLTFSLSVPAGGADGTFGSCSATASGQGSVSGTSMSGSYTGTNSCSGTVSSGTLTLSRQ